MRSETLSLAGTLNEAQAMQVATALNAVKGVSRIAVSTTNGAVSVDFDDEVTSAQELRAALQRAGLGVKRAHGEEGMCCGSCGS